MSYGFVQARRWRRWTMGVAVLQAFYLGIALRLHNGWDIAINLGFLLLDLYMIRWWKRRMVDALLRELLQPTTKKEKP